MSGLEATSSTAGDVRSATYRLTGDYGIFTVTRVVRVFAEAGDDLDHVAFTQTGIGTDLEAAGWAVSFDDCAEADWTIERLDR